jgi:hypothetical protein
MSSVPEPKTRVEVNALIEATFPRATSYTSWIDAEEPRRHISIRFGQKVFEGAGSTWNDAIADIVRTIVSRALRNTQ